MGRGSFAATRSNQYHIQSIYNNLLELTNTSYRFDTDDAVYDVLESSLPEHMSLSKMINDIISHVQKKNEAFSIHGKVQLGSKIVRNRTTMLRIIRMLEVALEDFKMLGELYDFKTDQSLEQNIESDSKRPKKTDSSALEMILSLFI